MPRSISSVAADDVENDIVDVHSDEMSSMSHPLIAVDDEGTPSSKEIRSNFIRMSALFAINHGCTVSVLGLSNARLGSVGVWQSGVLYASYTLAALFGASYFVKRLGSRNGLVLGMGMSASYVTSFFLATLLVGNDDRLVWMQSAVAIGGAIVGGVGSSILWVSQGSYFTIASQTFASEEGEVVEDVTGKFGGNFAFIFLVFEVISRLLSTFLIETAGLSWKVIFGLYSLLSIIPVFCMLGVIDVERRCRNSNRYRTLHQTEDAEESEEDETRIHKATAALDLLKKDPKMKYLSPINILFGLSTSFSMSVINGEVIQKVLSDPNSTYVGLYTAITSSVAAVASLLFGILESSHNQLHCGKGLVLTIGASSYLIIAVQFLIFPDGDDWNRVTLLSIYTLLGVGRATYEGTLRAAFADFFPNDKEGAFGNIIFFSGMASTVGYVLSVTGALHCEDVSRYCMEYSDGSIHNVLFMELVIVFTALVAIPAFWRAVWMFRRERNLQENDGV